MTPPVNGSIQVDLTASHVLNKFVPQRALGSSIDAVGIGGVPTQFSAGNVSKMLSAGFGSISYRLYTELNVEDWHWNPSGTWSDAANNQGYFTGSSTVHGQIVHSYGFLLPHRGSTFDMGDNLDYSRITDGDPTTYWKSNPYLTSAYTHESDSLHPQWVMVDLGSVQSVNAIKINWANPYAIQYSVQYWTGDDAIYDPTNGNWVNFTGGVVTKGAGGTVTLKLSSSPISAEFIRVVMTQSSGTFDTHGKADARNAMGYAISEIGVGTMNASSHFTDLINHSKDQTQTASYVSSTDPWHNSSGQNPETEQAGLDYVLAGSAAQHMPAMVAIPMVYSNPDTALAEISYLNRCRYPLIGVELGEEPDGQLMSPEDYGAFYVQWASAIHAANPSLAIGGPVLSGSGEVDTWPNAAGKTDWMQRFVAYLTTHKALSLLNFVSTEHYPFTASTTDWSLLTQEPGQIQDLFAEFKNANVPSTVPVYVTEFNFNAVPSEVPVDLMGALWHTVFTGEFLNQGGAGSFFYQYLPSQLDTNGTVYGLLGMFTADDNDQATGTTSQYFSSQLMNLFWCLPGQGQHSVLPATTSVKDGSGNPVVMPYVLLRPDGQYSVLLVNADSASHAVQVSFKNTTTHYFTGNVAQSQFSAKDYVWKPNGFNGTAKPNGPIEHATVKGGNGVTYALPAQSITVLCGKIL